MSEGRDWIKDINEHASNASTIRARVAATQSPDMLSFREKMIKFASKQE